MGDVIIWLTLLLLIVLFNGTASYLHKNGKLSLWISGIIMGLLVPVIGILLSNLFLGISRMFYPDSTHEGSGFAAAFIVLVLLANAVLLLIIGIGIKIRTYVINKKANI
ncbi:inner-membrane translocator [Alkalibacillus aidingensis]|uniref:inner-membrane translocator n=1 Tax=Alkalibacillus aidingensis TaxID=2747607 RepID=UPI0016613944|nr:inner-membrane translocator [Alkalibacillus aidingensis]